MLLETAKSFLPALLNGTVVHGFQRGSKKLGCPTANLSDNVVSKLDQNFLCGVYYGYANVDNGPVYRAVMSVGMNPHFNNTIKTIEAHLLNEFKDDFYGSNLKVVVIGFLREMTSFNNIDELKTAIQNDIKNANAALDLHEKVSNIDYRLHTFFTLEEQVESVILNVDNKFTKL